MTPEDQDRIASEQDQYPRAMTKIPLPQVPSPETVDVQCGGIIIGTARRWSDKQLRALQLATAKTVQEACAKVCERKRMVRGGEVFAAEIRALEFE